MTTALLMRREERLLRLTLHRPEKRNAIRVEDCRSIVAALKDAESDSNVGAILLDSSGSVFCAGMDLSESLEEGTPERAAIHAELFTIGSRLLKPLVIAVQGKTMAGGVGLVANGHVVVASEEAGFALTEIRIGLWPFVVFRSIAMAIGEHRALELSLTGRMIAAQEALRLGLVHQVVPATELGTAATKIASELARRSPEALRVGLDFVQKARALPQAEAVQLADTMRRGVFRSADFAEGVRAFFDKREPQWPSIHGITEREG